MPTLGEVIREIAAKFGLRKVSDHTIEFVIWEKTGYPCFWPDRDKTPEENFRMQVEEWAKKAKETMNKKAAKKTKTKKKGKR